MFADGGDLKKSESHYMVLWLIFGKIVQYMFLNLNLI